jgi:hypothetical protein
MMLFNRGVYSDAREASARQVGHYATITRLLLRNSEIVADPAFEIGAYMTAATVIISLIHILCAIVAYWHLITGGWLSHLNENIFNLFLAIFEVAAVAVVIAHALLRKPIMKTVLVNLFWVQMILGIGVVIWIALIFVSLKGSGRLF